MSEWAVTRSFAVSKRYKAEMTLHSTGRLDCVWSPRVPKQLSPAEWQRYREGRAELVSMAEKRLGGKIVMVEL